LSDIKEELDAAKSCGIKTMQLVRDTDFKFIQGHPTVKSFNNISF
jgi:methionine salvage enolase-phosphatase E1